MADFLFVLDRNGVRDLLLSEEVATMLKAEAESRCPQECETDVQPGKNRQVARIRTATERAYWRNYHKNTLLKAIGGKK